MPPAAEVQSQLERILATGPLANGGRLGRLLRYVVERTLAGEGDQLKEYVLGTEVFDRSGEYDPRIDSIVRVEARRLRSKLDEYYMGPGAGDPIAIEIPRGSYVPVFSWRSAPAIVPAAVAIPEAPPVRSVPSVRFLAVAGFLAGVITVVIFAALSPPSDSQTRTEASSLPSIAVLPCQHFSTDAAAAQLAARVTDGVTTELARLGTVAVASRTSASRYTGETRPVPEIAKALNVDLVMEASAIMQSGTLHVQARLVDGVVDRKVWVGTYDRSPDEVPALTRQIATEAAAAALAARATRK